MTKQATTKKAVQQVQRVPAATGHTLMSSANQFRATQVRDAKKYPGSICIKGHEYLSSLSTTSGTTGKNLLNLYLNPQSFPNTRLKKYSELYDKFLFRKFTLHYTSADPSSATGQYIIAYDRDFADTTPSADDAGIRKYFAMAGSQISNVYLSSSFKCPLTDNQDFYYTNFTGEEGRIVYQGQLYMASVSGTTFHGSLWIEYECDFYDPSLEDEPSVLTSFDDSTGLILGPSGSLHLTSNLLDNVPTNFFGSKNRSFEVKALANHAVFVDGIERLRPFQKGIIMPPGDWVIEFRAGLLDASASAGEGISSFVPTFFPFDATTVKNGYPTDDTDLDLDLTIIEYSGTAIGDNNSSAVIRFLVSIPPTAALVWFFLSGLLTSGSSVYYAESMLQIIAARAYALLPDMTRSQKLSSLVNTKNGGLLGGLSWPKLEKPKESVETIEDKDPLKTPESIGSPTPVIVRKAMTRLKSGLNVNL